MEYRIEWGTYINELEMKVNAMLKAGWKLQGGASFTVKGNDSLFIQPMIKNKIIKRKVKNK